ncbi:MAG TPA: translation initiation factor IF-3 [bacterium]|nr:translation initiation factor IF-3 [bacterium]
MRRTFRKPKPKEEKKFRANYQITLPEVFVIDENGKSLGMMPTEKAIHLAEEAELDLVEVNPNGNPPVTKILDYGQFRYQVEKKMQQQKAKQKKVDIKEVRLSIRIGDHDFKTRIEQGNKFLIKGNKLKITVAIKGREKQHPEKAEEMLNRYMSDLEALNGAPFAIEEPLTRMNGRFSITVVNKK